MRRILALAALGVALMIPAAAGGETFRQTLPFQAFITECGNTIFLSGDIALLVVTNQTPSGKILVISQVTSQNISGTDVLGRRYIGTITNRFTEVTTLLSGADVFTFVNRFHIVGTEGAPTLYVTETRHLTVSPSGETVVDFQLSSAECV